MTVLKVSSFDKALRGGEGKRRGEAKIRRRWQSWRLGMTGFTGRGGPNGQVGWALEMRSGRKKMKKKIEKRVGLQGDTG
jgi:hypothetical protein